MPNRTSERSAACATCGKTFARSDTLVRHEKSHHATEDRGPVHRVIDGTFRACVSCAQARSRCSGGQPCGRCKTRDLECKYPNKRRKGINNDVASQPVFSSTESHNTARPEQSQLQTQYPIKFQEFVFSADPTAAFTADSQSQSVTVKSSSETSMMNHMQPSPHHPGSDGLHLSPEISLSTSGMNQGSSNGTNVRNITSVPNNLPYQDQYSNMSVPIQYQDTMNDRSSVYDPMYDESLNLNWIPLSIYPSPYGDMEHDFNFLVPSLSDTASLNNDFNSAVFDPGIPGMMQSGGGTQLFNPPLGHRQSPSISRLVQSPTSSNSGQTEATSYSIGDVTTLEHKRKRRKLSQMPDTFTRPKEIRVDFFFPENFDKSESHGLHQCSESVYDSMVAVFRQLCIGPSNWKAFSTAFFPGRSTINACIELYFEQLHPTLPLLHASTFSQSADWLMCLATAAIGSVFTSLPGAGDAREAFQEFLRRAILFSADDGDADFGNIPLAQARILHLVSLAHSDREQLRLKTPRSHADLSRWCLESGILQLTSPDEEVRSDQDIDEAWHRWIQQESLRRVGYFIWYLDCALGYICNARPLCNMDDARTPLPCTEALWDASSSQEWLLKRNNTPKMPSLCAALETMYNKKAIDPGLSEISLILLIHALYSRTWEVGTHIKQPLSEWKATGNSKGFLNTPSKDNFWLPLYPLYANWRNSACDCLDVLHWQAQAQMAKNSGAEHHGILHLHLARVILLTPFQEIQDLIFFLINHRVGDHPSKASFYVHDGSYQTRDAAKLQQIRKITWRWLREDQHKARLATIHAGSVFWHVRRYSTNSFFEPIAIYLASIVLWTYGSYKSAALARDAAISNNENGSGNATVAPTIATTAQNPSKMPVTNNDLYLDQTQSEPGADQEVQPTRVERAARDYMQSKSRSSRHSRPSHMDLNSVSPADSQSHVQGHTYQSLDEASTFTPPALVPTHAPASENATITSTTIDSFHPQNPNPHGTNFDDDNNKHNPTNTNNPTARSPTPSPGATQSPTSPTPSHSHSSLPHSSSSSNDSEDDEDDQPSFIHLDRPCDDEIVQHFVRTGHNMSGYMSNVGDICKTPTKVLVEGAKVLRTRLACWGVSREYHDILIRLAEVKDRDRDRDRDGGGGGHKRDRERERRGRERGSLR